jgi:hypothetical protein
MLAELAVPEPGLVTLLATAMLFLTSRCRRKTRQSTHDDELITNLLSNSSTAGDTTMTARRRSFAHLLAAAVLAVVVPSAHAVILEDFPFNDDNGTLLNEAENVANPGNAWLFESDRMTNSMIQDGVFRVQKDTTNLGRNVLDISNNISSGKGWIVAEIAGWSFSSGSEPGGFDPGNLEHFRITFLNNDSNLTTASSFVTSEARIQRTAAGGLELLGTALGTGGTNVTGTQPSLPLNQTQPFTFVLELDKNANEYSIYYKSASESTFSLFGTASVAADRAGNAMRLSYQGRFDGDGEFFDLDRIYATTTNPLDLPVIPTVLTLEVKSNGQVAIRNDTSVGISFNSYRIESPTADLNFAGWNSLSDQNLDALGTGVGETWDEAGGSSDVVLAESFLLGSSTVGQGGPAISLGSAFKPGGNHEQLIFQYHDINTGAIITGEVAFVTVGGLEGDYNNDGKVDAADYVLWRKSGINGQQGYDTWRANFGMTAGSGSMLSTANVPEPATLLLAVVTIMATTAHRWFLRGSSTGSMLTLPHVTGAWPCPSFIPAIPLSRKVWRGCRARHGRSRSS